MTKISYTNLTKEEVLKRTKEILPLVIEKAKTVEKERKPDDEVIRRFAEAGIYAACVPKRFGGAELNFDTMIAVTRMIAQHCMSTAWVVGFYMGHNIMICRMPLKCQELAFADKPYTQTPAGGGKIIAKSVDGGYMIKGRAFWGTGVMHADWVIGTAALEGGTRLDTIQFVAPASEVIIHDVWHMAGMAGTGSNDYEFREIFVPKHRTILAQHFLNGTSEGAMIHSNPMYRQPLLSVMYGEIMGIYVGGLEGMHNYYNNFIKSKVTTLSAEKVAEKPIGHLNLGTAYADVYAATDLLRAFIEDLLAQQNQQVSLEKRASNKVRASYLVRHCRNALNDIFAHCGASSFRLENSAQRFFRDLNLLSVHGFMDWDAARENWGRVWLGLPPNTRVI